MATQKMTLRDRQKQQTRAHLLAVAGELFAEKGFADTSIDDIVGAAGTSRATLYAYFNGKDALLADIVDEMWREGEQFWREFGELPDWSRASILSWLQRFAAQYAEDAARNRAAAMASGPRLLEIAQERHRGMARSVRARTELWRHFPEPEADLRAAMVVTVVESQLDDYFVNSSPLDLAVFLGYLADAVRSLIVE